MLRVKTPDEALEIIQTAFRPLERPPEQVPLSGALGRVLARNIEASAAPPWTAMPYGRPTLLAAPMQCPPCSSG